MASTFVVIGDFHARPDARLGEQLATLDLVVARGLELHTAGRLAAWLWLGDLAHNAQTIAIRNALADRIERMANVAPVVLVRGNHDAPGDLYVFSKVRAAHPVYLVEDAPQVLRFRTATGINVSAACLPYPEKGGLAALGVAPAGVNQAAGDILEIILERLAHELAAGVAAGDAPLFLTHANVAGALTSVGQPNIGKEIELAPRSLDRLGVIPKIANHIHKAQEIFGVHYPGSLTRLDWGEVEPKGYVELELARDVAPFVANGKDLNAEWIAAAPAARLETSISPARWFYRIEWLELPVPPMYHVEGKLSREGFDYVLTKGPGGDAQASPESWKGAWVRVRYRFNATERGALNEARILALFAEAARLELEPIAVPDRALRAPAVVEAITLGAKVQAYAELAGAVAPASVLDKLAALEHTDGLELVSQTADWLAVFERSADDVVVEGSTPCVRS